MTEFKTLEGDELVVGGKYECRDGEIVTVVSLDGILATGNTETYGKVRVRDSYGTIYPYHSNGDFLPFPIHEKGGDPSDLMRRAKEDKPDIAADIVTDPKEVNRYRRIGEVVEGPEVPNLRDSFAIAAPEISEDEYNASEILDWYEAAAVHAYKYADAMLKAREIKNDTGK